MALGGESSKWGSTAQMGYQDRLTPVQGLGYKNIFALQRAKVYNREFNRLV